MSAAMIVARRRLIANLPKLMPDPLVILHRGQHVVKLRIAQTANHVAGRMPKYLPDDLPRSVGGGSHLVMRVLAGSERTNLGEPLLKRAVTMDRESTLVIRVPSLSSVGCQFRFLTKSVN
jgi:hypothetical protein